MYRRPLRDRALVSILSALATMVAACSSGGTDGGGGGNDAENDAAIDAGDDAGDDVAADSTLEASQDAEPADTTAPADGADTSVTDSGAPDTLTPDTLTPDTLVGDTVVADTLTPDASTDGGGGDGGTIDLTKPVTPGDPGTVDVRFTIRSDTGVKPISPLIYGTSGMADSATNKPLMVRGGGNRMTAYNWEMNGSNAGSDYCYQNDGTFGTAASGPANAYKAMLDDAKTRGTAALVTVPIVDYVAADTNDNGDGGCGTGCGCVGDVRKSGSNYLTTRFKQNKPVKGSAFSTSPSTSDAYVYQDEFVNYVKTNWGTTKVLFALDNEPDLWSSTHAEIHPVAVTYAELVKRNVDYAKAIKATWPTALVTGFVSYGFAGYTTLQNATDSGANGDFITYYLKQMKAADTANGKRLVDYLDLHWYTEARGGGVRVSDVVDGTGAAERIQSVRSLWDSTYKEDSWIVNDYLHAPINLIPSLNAKIAANYPGTQLAFTEWNNGGGEHISGAVSTADMLGVFGREGVGAASLWFTHDNRPWGADQEHFTRAGLRVFTNYDGAGAKFGDTTLSSVSSDDSVGSVYGSVDAANPGRVVLVLINKAATTKTAGLRLAHPRTFTRAKVWTLSGTNSNIVAAADVTTVALNAFKYAMPAMSVSILVPQP
jgi:hypothetical protein